MLPDWIKLRNYDVCWNIEVLDTITQQCAARNGKLTLGGFIEHWCIVWNWILQIEWGGFLISYKCEFSRDMVILEHQWTSCNNWVLVLVIWP